MKINEVITKIKAYHKGYDLNGNLIKDETSRDQILYGNGDNECSGIVTTCFASADVIRQAAKLGANMIICHESLFWNHGDATDWLAGNQVFLAKKKLLDETGITVWRDHDYIHSGIPIGDARYSDGIFYGLMKVLGWESYLIESMKKPLVFQMPPTTVRSLARSIIEKLNLKGIRIVGDPDTTVRRILVAEHIIGRGDNEKITKIETEDIDAIITLELIDYTVSEYIRDASMLDHAKTILAVGHFNVEEPGMQYMADYLPGILGKNIGVTYVQSGDAYDYIVR